MQHAVQDSSPYSVRRTRSHAAQQPSSHKSLLRDMRSESRRVRRSACNPLGPRSSHTRPARRRQRDMRTRHAGTHQKLHSHKRAHTSVLRPNREKLQLHPQCPRSRGTAKKSVSLRRKVRLQLPVRQRHLRHTMHDSSDLLPSRSRLNYYLHQQDPHRSGKFATCRYDFRHQPLAGCKYSSSAVLRTTGCGVS